MDDGRRTTDGTSLLIYHIPRFAPVVLSGLLIALFYGYALNLPYYFDDLPVLEWLERQSLAEVWTRSNENDYYRPLTFSVYKLALSLRKGVQQKVLHGAKLLLHWAAAVGVGWLARRTDEGRTTSHEACADERRSTSAWATDDRKGPSPLKHADLLQVCATVLYAMFPFFFRAVPWVTAMPHSLVIGLSVVAALAALRAEERGHAGWWAVSLAATALAPFAHESGLVCGAIVGGLVLLQPTARWSWKRFAWVAVGVALNGGALVLRSLLPGTGAFSPKGIETALENVLFALHGLAYPLGTAIGWLARRGGHDLTLVGGAAGLCALLLASLAWRTRSWRWIVQSLWWWGCASLPSLLAFRYGSLVNAPRFYALPAVGIVMLWAGAIVRLSDLASHPKGFVPTLRRTPLGSETRSARHVIAVVVSAAMVSAIVVPNALFLWQQRQVHLALFDLYQQIIAVAESDSPPLGYVNVPAWLAPKKQTYALAKDGATGLALYNDVRQLVRVNTGRPIDARNVMHVHTLYEPEDAWFGFHGDWPDGAGMRQFALDHRSIWLTRYREHAKGSPEFVLQHVGTLYREQDACAKSPLVRFEGGTEIVSAVPVEMDEGRAGVALTWRVAAPLQARIFVHVVDAQNAIVAQAGGPALGGLLPTSAWQPGDCIYDVRTLDRQLGSGGPFTVLVGLYEAQGRLPAYVDGARAPDDAAPVTEIVQ